MRILEKRTHGAATSSTTTTTTLIVCFLYLSSNVVVMGLSSTSSSSTRNPLRELNEYGMIEPKTPDRSLTTRTPLEILSPSGLSIKQPRLESASRPQRTLPHHPEDSSSSSADYTMGQGIEFVQKLAMEMRAQRQEAALSNEVNGAAYPDLVQEGLVALLQATQDYSRFDHPRVSLRQYATSRIRLAMSTNLSHSRPIELPPRIEQLLQRAHRVKNQLANDKNNSNNNKNNNNSNSNSDDDDDDNYTNELVARRLGVTPEALRRYERASRGALSVESTLEIQEDDDPDTAILRDNENDWYSIDFWSLDGDNPPVDDHHRVDDDLDDQVPRTVEPLRNVIQDTTQPSPDRVLWRTMLQHDLSTLLDDTLSKEEAQLIRMRYGFQERLARTVSELSYLLHMSPQAVRRMELRSLTKLRRAFRQRYAETYPDDNDDFRFIEDSV